MKYPRFALVLGIATLAALAGIYALAWAAQGVTDEWSHEAANATPAQQSAGGGSK